MKHQYFLSLAALLVFSISTYSQSDKNGNVDVLDYFSLDTSEFNIDVQLSNLNLIRPKSNLSAFFPIDEIYQRIPWTDDPAINFKPVMAFENIGDVNGDGLDDLIQVRNFVKDERRDNKEIFTFKTFLTYGGDDFSLDYDELFYNKLYPLGDLNGDGFDDAIGIEVNEESEQNIYLYKGSSSGLIQISSINTEAIGDLLIDKSTSIILNKTLYNAFEDFNDDSYDDVYGFHPSFRERVYFEITGAASFEEVQIKEIELADSVYIEEGSLNRFVINGATYLTLNAGNRSSSRKNVHIYKLLPEGSLQLVQKFNFPSEFSQYSIESFIGDYNGDGLLDLLTSSYDGIRFASGLSSTFASFGELKMVSTEGNTLSHIFQVGDINEDNKDELLILKDYSASIINFEGSNTDTISNFLPSEFIPNGYFQRFTTSIIPNTSFQDGFKTFVISVNSNDYIDPITEDEKFGNALFKTSDNASTFETNIILQNHIDYIRKERNEVFHLGDIENDNIDNFAVRELTNNDEQLVIYNGLDLASAKSIPIDPSLNVRFVQSGFFNNTSQKTLAILADSVRDGQTIFTSKSVLLYYDINDLNEPFHSILSEDISPTNRMEIFANLGDINNDGFDDVGWATTLSNEPEHVFLFLGKEKLSDNPDLDINLNEDFNNPLFGTTFWGATVLQGLGDMNSDGIDDFVIGDAQRLHSLEILEQSELTGGNFSGVVYVLFGKEDFLSEFSGPDLELWPDTTDLSNEQVFFGGLNNVASGDFDGDGVQDIVTKSFRHADSEFDEGVGALTYFFGKEGLSSQPDTTVRIRNEYIAPERSSSENIYSKFSGRSLLKAVPGKNGEGADRLLFVPGSSLANAVLYEIEKEPTEVAVARFSAPAENTSLNPAGNFINKQYFPLVGDYTGNGQFNFLGYQPNSRIYRDTPIYMFGIDNILNSNEEGVEGNPNIYKLEQNYPNPFNPSTNISFTIPVSENVEITVYNILGKKVSDITNKKFTKGTHTVSFDASHLASGFYLYQINTNSFISTKKMILIK